MDTDLPTSPAPSRDAGTPVRWYRPKISREDMSSLNRKSDLRGALQTLGFLVTLALTGTLAYLSVGHLPWYVCVLAFALHATCYNFLINGFHELIHESVFKTRKLNDAFLYIFSFLGQYNHVQFWASHTEHHKFTLHPPDDLEVILPFKDLLPHFLKHAIINPLALYNNLRTHLRWSVHKLKGDWENHLFPPTKPELRKQLARWSRFVLLGHTAIALTALYFGQWPLLLIITFAPYYAGMLHWLCNNTQHTGLRDNVPDFRLCCRTLHLNPVFRFLYWHMNYHTEHHMYAGVPCYNLHRLHHLIRHELPPTPQGLLATWLEIAKIARRQRQDPTYQHTPPIPTTA